MPFNLFISSLYILDFIILLSLDNDVRETSKRRAMFFLVFYRRIVLSKVLPNLYLVVLFRKRENFANNSIGKLTAQLKSISAVYYSRVSITFSSYCLFNDTITVTVRYLICLEFFFCKPCNARFIFSSKRR